ncbi:MAG TPA: glycoside hydrolase family 3 N-terminal domain-containing protein, partial [Bacteroidales bacterium]|nr:glycoside hydrolase family 3 N-terminal domain-containing protein [Bacteroidales bacterium]
MNSKHLTFALTVCILSLAPFAGKAQKANIEHRVDSLLNLMTLEEKIGQMNQYSGFWEATGPITEQGNKLEQVRTGQLGSLLNITGVDHTRQLQEMALQSRLKIPLLFGQDVVHGYRTIF